MARIQFKIKGREVYKTTIRVRVDDVNYGGHLGNDSVLTLCHEARIRFLNESGHSEANFYGEGIIMTDAMVLYKAEGNWGDKLDVTVHLDDVGRYGFDFYYSLTSQGKEIVRVKTGIAFFDYGRRKIAACPAEFTQKYG